MHYTRKVRRGFQHLIDMGLGQNVERRIEYDTRKGQKLVDKMPAATASDIRAAMAWLEQEAGADAVAVAVEEDAPA